MVFPKRGLVVSGKRIGLRALYQEIKKHVGNNTLSFILAAHFAQGFEDAKAATEEERLDVVQRWRELAPNLKREQTGSSYATSGASLSTTTSSTSSVATLMSSASTLQSTRKP